MDDRIWDDWNTRFRAEDLRSQRLDHLIGVRFCDGMPPDEFGILQTQFQATELLDKVIHLFRRGHSNLDILIWALDEKKDLSEVHEILELIDTGQFRPSD